MARQTEAQTRYKQKVSAEGKPAANTAVMSYEDVALEMTRRGYRMSRRAVELTEQRAIRKLRKLMDGLQP